jgi:L-methionine (R)-S-oxide reductase
MKPSRRQQDATSTARTRRKLPSWYNPDEALRSAVEYVASISPKFNWVGIYVLHGDTLELGPYVGVPTEHTRIRVGVGVCGTAIARNEDLNVADVTKVENYLACSVETAAELVVLVRDRVGRVLGQIDIDSHTRGAFGPAEEQAVKQAARDLGELWELDIRA